MNRTTLATALLLALAANGCASEPDETRSGEAASSDDARPTSDLLTTATELEVRNARMPVPNLLTAGQPSEAQLGVLVEGGIRHAISLRPVSEEGAGWEEAHATDAGYRFDRLPISGAESLTRENVEAFAALLDESGDEPTVLYCASSNRVGALLALKAAWLDGADPEDALELGRSAGLSGLEGAVSERLGIE